MSSVNFSNWIYHKTFPFRRPVSSSSQKGDLICVLERLQGTSSVYCRAFGAM